MYRKQPQDPRAIIELLRAERGFPTVKALALAADVPQPTLSRYLSGKHEWMDTRHYLAIARALGVTMSELLGEVPIASQPVREVQTAMAKMDDEQRAQLARVSKALIER